MSQHNDEQLNRLALEMATSHLCPPKEMLLHSDQGSPYSSTGYLLDDDFRRTRGRGVVAAEEEAASAGEEAILVTLKLITLYTSRRNS